LTIRSANGSSLLAGVGASYTLDGHLSIRLDYLRVDKTGDDNSVGKFSVNAATVGVSYTF
jgi:opacity protein-like surface antigen